MGTRFALLTLLLFTAIAPADSQERERNFWPVVVQQLDDDGEVRSWSAAGPLLFARETPDGGRTRGVRPLWVDSTNEHGELRTALGLYPFFTWSADDERYRWEIFELVRHRGLKSNAFPTRDNTTHHASAWSPRLEAGPKLARAAHTSAPSFGEGAPCAITVGGVAPARDEAFEIWPFWWSRQTGDPDTSYRALFPIAGTLKRRLGFERIAWAPFPLYVRTEERGAVTTHTPWPFVRTTRGAAQGFGLWPLYGRQRRANGFRDAFYLWPFGYDRITPPPSEAPADTPASREVGALPFYARSTGPGYRSESYLWPFFGYTERTAPESYRETRYFWPILVQGRGDDRYVNRWGPFYTHSIRNGYEKTWIAWPVYRRLRHSDDVLTQTKHQLGYFLYWSLEQRSATNPELAPAHARHVWPLFSSWDNGAGRRQFQFPSPLEVFFPANASMRQTWGPLFSLYRQESRGPGHVRASLCWSAVTWERDPAAGHREFHVGPLLTYARNAEAMKFEIAHGLVGLRRTEAGRSWRLLWFTFGAR
jgi:hypothetical protein